MINKLRPLILKLEFISLDVCVCVRLRNSVRALHLMAKFHRPWYFSIRMYNDYMNSYGISIKTDQPNECEIFNLWSSRVCRLRSQSHNLSDGKRASSQLIRAHCKCNCSQFASTCKTKIWIGYMSMNTHTRTGRVSFNTSTYTKLGWLTTAPNYNAKPDLYSTFWVWLQL